MILTCRIHEPLFLIWSLQGNQIICIQQNLTRSQPCLQTFKAPDSRADRPGPLAQHTRPPGIWPRICLLGHCTHQPLPPLCSLVAPGQAGGHWLCRTLPASSVPTVSSSGKAGARITALLPVATPDRLCLSFPHKSGWLPFLHLLVPQLFIQHCCGVHAVPGAKDYITVGERQIINTSPGSDHIQDFKK